MRAEPDDLRPCPSRWGRGPADDLPPCAINIWEMIAHGVFALSLRVCCLPADPLCGAVKCRVENRLAECRGGRTLRWPPSTRHPLRSEMRWLARPRQGQQGQQTPTSVLHAGRMCVPPPPSPPLQLHLLPRRDSDERKSRLSAQLIYFCSVFYLGLVCYPRKNIWVRHGVV